MLRLENINKAYEIRKDLKQDVLEDLNVEFPNKGFISIVGNSGSGKTTLLNIVAGLDQADSGTIYYNDKKIDNFDDYRQSLVGVVFQDYNLIDHLNIVDNVILSITDDKKDKKSHAVEILGKLGLGDYLHKKPKHLSGGQKQRVAIARMIAMDVDIFICDEPTGSLDAGTTESIVDLLKDLSKEKLILFVTHNLDIAKKYSDNILEMKSGQVESDLSYPVEKKAMKPNRSYHKNVKWLAIKNLLGKYKMTLKFVMLTAFIMLMSALAIILNTEVFREYIHDYYLSEGIKTMNVWVDYHADFDEIKKDVGKMHSVIHVAKDYSSRLGIATSNLEKNRTPTGPLAVEVEVEEITDNDYLKSIITAGRLPEKPDEIVVSAESAIIMLSELKLGGQRLFDQFKTGGLDNDYVFNLIDDKKFIIVESGYPRIQVVGLVDDTKIREDHQTVYFYDGFLELYESTWPLKANAFKIYKDSLYEEDEIILEEELVANEDFIIDRTTYDNRRLYNKIDSMLELSTISLIVIIVIAAVSYISLISSSIFERKYEIGLYRTTGYNNKLTAGIFGYEMFFINITSITIVIAALVYIVYYVTQEVHAISSYGYTLSNLNIPSIIGMEILILLAFTIGTIYFTQKKILKDTIIANIRDL